MDSPQVVSIGEALVDVISEAGQPTREVPGGSPANVALTLSRLGRRTLMHAWLADDARGQAVAAHLRASGVEISPESWGATRTPTAAAAVDEEGHATYEFDLEWAPRAPLPIPAGTGIVHAGSIGAVLRPGATAVEDAMSRAMDTALVTFDPNVRPTIMRDQGLTVAAFDGPLAHADLIKVSDEDIDWMRGNRTREAVIEDWIAAGVNVIIMTAGKDGARAWSASGCEVHVPADGSVVVEDTVGAGDSFMGGILDQMITEGLSGAAARDTLFAISADTLERLLRRGARVADVTVSRVGANPPTSADLGEGEGN